jgi:hypothetical protein
MKSPLYELLTKLLSTQDSKNPAFNYLLNDYAKYHYVMVILGGLSCIALAILSISQFNRLRISGSFTSHLKTTRGIASLFLSSLSGILAISLGLILIGNLGNALNPRAGFKNSLDMLGNPSPGTQAAQLQQSYVNWIQSEKSTVPNYVTQVINERISWQLPKALICSLLLVVFVYLSKLVWKQLLRENAGIKGRHAQGLFVAGIFLSFITLLLLIMSIANAQGSIAPVSLSLFFA